LLYKTKDHDGAIKAFHQAIRLEDDSKDAFRIRSVLAEALRDAGRLEEAEVEAKTLIDRLEDMYIPPLNELLASSARAGAVTPAAVASVYTRLADVYDTQGRTMEALALLQKGIQRIPTYPGLFRELAETYIDVGNTSKAIESYISYFRVFPVDDQQVLGIEGESLFIGQSLHDLVDLFITENRIDDARDFLSQEHDLKRNVRGLENSTCGTSPTYKASLHWAEAYLLYAEGRRRESIVEWRKCVEIQPQLHGAWQCLAYVCGFCGDFPKAVEYQEKAIDALKLMEHSGVGTLTSHIEGNAKIATVSPDSPADQAGIKVGDIIVAINGLSIVGVPFREYAPKINGPPGTQVTLTIKRDLVEHLQNITLTREETTSPRLIEYQDQLAAYKAGKTLSEAGL